MNNNIIFRTFRALKNLKISTRRKMQGLAAGAFCTVAGATILASCSMVNEDMPECAIVPNTYTIVNFVYDYNMFREDLFNEHAGTAHLYVFDKDSIFLFDRSLSRNEMTGPEVDFSMMFDTTEIRPGKKYFMLAMAQGNHSGYDWSTVVTPGFQIPLEHQMEPGVSKISDYRIKLDRDDDGNADLGIVNYKDAYGNNKELMDTLWSTKPNQIQTVEIPLIEYRPQVEEYPVMYYDVVIPMMRITNTIKINILNDNFDADFDTNRFKMLLDFPKGNGTIGFTGTVYHNQPLQYHSLRKEMTPYVYNKDNAQVEGNTKSGATRADQQYALQAVFGCSRLQTTDDSSLQIYLADNDELILKIGGDDAEIAPGKTFSQWLADYFNSYYDDQEFLDREYNFTIDIHLDNKYIWDWYEIKCEVLGWGKRVYRYTLH